MRQEACPSLDACSQADVHSSNGNGGSSDVAYLLKQGRHFAGPTWFRDRLTREVKKWAAFWAPKPFSISLLAEDVILQCFSFLGKLRTHEAERLQSWSTELFCKSTGSDSHREPNPHRTRASFYLHWNYKGSTETCIRVSPELSAGSLHADGERDGACLMGWVSIRSCNTEREMGRDSQALHVKLSSRGRQQSRWSFTGDGQTSGLTGTAGGGINASR